MVEMAEVTERAEVTEMAEAKEMKETFTIEPTEDYDGLTALFIRNELEFSEEDPVPTDTVKCFQVIKEDGTGRVLVGGLALARRQGEFIIDGIAVDPEYQKHKLGSLLLEKAILETRSRGGESIYLVARAPEFFRKHGFCQVPKEEAPYFFECLTCPQCGITCHPQVMKLAL